MNLINRVKETVKKERELLEEYREEDGNFSVSRALYEPFYLIRRTRRIANDNFIPRNKIAHLTRVLWITDIARIMGYATLAGISYFTYKQM